MENPYRVKWMDAKISVAHQTVDTGLALAAKFNCIVVVWHIKQQL